MAIKMNKCDQLETKRFIVSVKNTKLLEEVFNNGVAITSGLAIADLR